MSRETVSMWLCFMFFASSCVKVVQIQRTVTCTAFNSLSWQTFTMPRVLVEQQLKPSGLRRDCRPPRSLQPQTQTTSLTGAMKNSWEKKAREKQMPFSCTDHSSFPFPPPSFWSTTALEICRSSPSKRQHRHNGRNVENIHSCLSLLPFSGSATWLSLKRCRKPEALVKPIM